jgi:hypothetical protein
MGVATDVRGEKEVCGPAMTLEEAVTLGARLDAAGLPHKGRAVDLTRALLAANAPRLVLTFLHYSRLSGVATLREATRFRLAGLQQLARDSGLDSRAYGHAVNIADEFVLVVQGAVVHVPQVHVARHAARDQQRLLAHAREAHGVDA